MLRVMFTPLVLVFGGLCASLFRPIFSVGHLTDASYSLSPARVRETERLYQSACRSWDTSFQSDVELRPPFTVVIGTERDELNFTSLERSG